MTIFSWWYPWWKSDRDLLTPISGDSTSYVGSIVIRNSMGAPTRVFYPAVSKGRGLKRTPMFRQGIVMFVRGYMILALGQSMPNYMISAIFWLIIPLVFLNPIAYALLPRCYNSAHIAPPPPPTKYPLLIFSHGLSGTGCEHGLMGVTLALRGYVCAFPHHSDGSSSLCEKVDASTKTVKRTLYKHPNFHDYDDMLRQRQVEHRAVEVNETREILLSHPDIGPFLDGGNVVVGGFSFGGSTAGLVAVMNPEKYRAAVFVDGWWKVNFPQYGIEIDLPSQLHSTSMPLPTLMLSSTEMNNIPNIRDKQHHIEDQCTAVESQIVMEGTRHGNFIDAVYWVPSCLARFVNLSGKLIHPHKFYAKYVGMVADFMDEQCKGEKGGYEDVEKVGEAPA